ncbi:hypothetical protein D1872_328390 [compost metagenome]
MFGRDVLEFAKAFLAEQPYSLRIAVPHVQAEGDLSSNHVSDIWLDIHPADGGDQSALVRFGTMR